MKKIFITTLLFFIALSVLAASSQQLLLQALLKDQTFNLTQGITLPKDQKPFNDFSDIVRQPPQSTTWRTSIVVEPDGHINPYKGWYDYDFAADPFDGRIEILVMGEPLPSATQTIMLTLGVLAILLYCRNTKWRQSETP